MRMMRCVLRSEQNHKLAAGAADVTCPNGQEGISWARLAQQEFDAFLHRAKVEHFLMSRLANRLGECLAGYSGNRGLAGGVDVGQYENVGEIESDAEIVPKGLRAGEPVRLEQDQQAVKLAATSGFERGANFGRVVAVVVDYSDSLDHAFDVEPAADAGKFGETFANQFCRHIEIES